MKTALIITLGSRDIKVEKDKLLLLPCFNEPLYYQRGKLMARAGGEFIFNQYKSRKLKTSDICVPIISPTMEYLLNQYERIDLIILISTNQEKPHPNDTTFFAQILQKLLSEKYHKKISDIRIKEIKEPNVIYLDSMMDYFRNELSKKPFSELSKPDWNICLHLVGGIDAVNNALRLNIIEHFGETVQEFHVNESTGQCMPIDSVKNLIKRNNIGLAQKLVTQFLYSAVDTIPHVPAEVKTLCAILHHRLHFDFKSAIDEAKKLPLSHRELADEIIHELNALKDNRELSCELFWNMHIKYEQRQFVDFLLRLFRLYEELCKECALSKMQDFQFSNENWQESFSQYLETKPELTAYLNGCKIGDQPLNYKTANTEVFLAVIEFFAKQDESLNEKIAFLKTVKFLAQLRNKSIGAHSFKPVSKEKIAEILKKNHLDDDKLFITCKNWLGVSTNPFLKYNQKINQFLT